MNTTREMLINTKKMDNHTLRIETDDSSRRVLYCGMANDIISPLMMFPNLKVLFAMDSFDYAYSTQGTRKSQRNDILNMLKGAPSDFYNNILPKEAIIKHVVRKPKYFRVRFKYNGMDRELHYFSMNYYKAKWPKMITNIDTLVNIGAPFAISRSVIRNRVSYNKARELLQHMVMERFQQKIFWVIGVNWNKRLQIDVGIRGYTENEYNDCIYVDRDFVHLICEH